MWVQWALVVVLRSGVCMCKSQFSSIGWHFIMPSKTPALHDLRKYSLSLHTRSAECPKANNWSRKLNSPQAGRINTRRDSSSELILVGTLLLVWNMYTVWPFLPDNTDSWGLHSHGWMFFLWGRLSCHIRPLCSVLPMHGGPPTQYLFPRNWNQDLLWWCSFSWISPVCSAPLSKPLVICSNFRL